MLINKQKISQKGLNRSYHFYKSGLLCNFLSQICLWSECKHFLWRKLDWVWKISSWWAYCVDRISQRLFELEISWLKSINASTDQNKLLNNNNNKEQAQCNQLSTLNKPNRSNKHLGLWQIPNRPIEGFMDLYGVHKGNKGSKIRVGLSRWTDRLQDKPIS